jgi:hypothetical protein
VFVLPLQSPVRDDGSEAPSSPAPVRGRRRSLGSDAVTSPVRELEEFEDETDMLGNDDAASQQGQSQHEEEDDGDDLFGDNMEA